MGCLQIFVGPSQHASVHCCKANSVPHMSLIESSACIDKANGNKHVVVTLLCSACGALAAYAMSPGLCVLEDSRPLTSVVDVPNWSCKTRGEWCFEVVKLVVEVELA